MAPHGGCRSDGHPVRRLVLFVLLVAGLLPRVLALSSPARVAASISEDGYLMLTVARNVADGRGLSTAAGTIPTNGVQPLVTFGWAGVHAMTADDGAALRVVVVIELLTALAGAFLVGALARRFFGGHRDVEAVSQLTTALWFASPVVLRHTTNGLETGIYAVCIAAVLLLDARWRERPSLGRAAAIGMLLGVTVLVRNDAALLVAAYTLVTLLVPATVGDGVTRRLSRAVVAGVASVVTASPWLVFNLVRFGHIVPISGRSQSLGTAFGESLVKVPRVLAEYLLGGLPLPDAAQVPGPWPLVVTAIVVAALALAWRHRRSLGVEVDAPLVVLVLFAAGLATYYGAFFAAGHFLSRYLFPLSLLTTGLVSAAIVTVSTRGGLAGSVVAAAFLAALLVADTRFAQRADHHPHMHVVEWVRANADAADWVAAPQSGTVGTSTIAPSISTER